MGDEVRAPAAGPPGGLRLTESTSRLVTFQVPSDCRSKVKLHFTPSLCRPDCCLSTQRALAASPSTSRDSKPSTRMPMFLSRRYVTMARSNGPVSASTGLSPPHPSNATASSSPAMQGRALLARTVAGIGRQTIISACYLLPGSGMQGACAAPGQCRGRLRPRCSVRPGLREGRTAPSHRRSSQ